ncbi:hypothetical protein DFP72DRAFT_608191 [Ephemerocybe angulata]|uniref:BTB domain-containing protein n=1 Tax=Ephemerocybe angulata TaxID=980116 RepID=A0A8H6LYB8_9AGAR|nr:hypothetical protein DFP72DRAFT_608191 [Tulosesus angulatus]
MTTTSHDMTQTACLLPSNADEEYYWDFVTFSVDDVLYRVPKYRFMNGSETFASEYGLDQDQGSEEEHAGVDDSSPDAVKTLDVAAADFRALLKVLYPKTDKASHQELSLFKDEWLAVLKLSSRWKFNSVRKLAIERLSLLSEMEPSERIRLGREYAVKSWLSSAYEELVTRKAVISNDEVKSIGWETINELWAVREMWRAHTACTCSTQVSLDLVIQDTFSAEFDGIGELQQQFWTLQEREEYVTHKAIEEAEQEEAAKWLAENFCLAEKGAEGSRILEGPGRYEDNRQLKLGPLSTAERTSSPTESLFGSEPYGVSRVGAPTETRTAYALSNFSSRSGSPVQNISKLKRACDCENIPVVKKRSKNLG